MKLKLVQTCGACPESYECFTPEGEEIGYLRLRHGGFYAEYLPTGEVVYTAEPKGDGCFEYDERNYYLGEACDALIRRHQNQSLEVKDNFYIGDYDGN